MEEKTTSEAGAVQLPESTQWYHDVSYKDAKIFIRTNLTSAARSFVAVGYYLKHIRDTEGFLEDGFESIWEFAQAEYGISKSTASRYMTMNDRFSQGGNSPVIREEYKEFGKSQLQEMLSLTDEQLEQVRPTDRVEDIRNMRKPREIPYIAIPGQVELTDFPGVEPADVQAAAEAREQLAAQSQEKEVYTVSAADLLGEDTTGSAQPVAISQQPEAEQIEPEEALSAYGTPKEVYPEDSLLTAVGCEGGHSCFDCHMYCGIRQQDCYCVEAPMGNPFPCEMVEKIPQLREITGVDCQFVDLNLADHRAGDNEPAPCCKKCTVHCEHICERAMKALGERAAAAAEKLPEEDYRPPEEEEIDESYNIGDLPQAKESQTEQVEDIYDGEILTEMIQKAEAELDLMEKCWKEKQPQTYKRKCMALEAYKMYQVAHGRGGSNGN